MTMLSVLHISDLHLGRNDTFDRNLVQAELIRYVERSNKIIDKIFLSGDVANSGELKQYNLATIFLNDLLAAANLRNDDIIICPGNHDVFVPSVQSFIRTLDSLEQSDAYFSSGKLHHVEEGQKNFFDWYESFSGRKIQRDSAIIEKVTINANGYFVEIASLNTAIFSRAGGDHGNLCVGRVALGALDDATREGVGQSPQGAAKILLHHHPLSWLTEAEQSRVEALVRKKFNVALRGHLHKSESTLTVSAHDALIGIASGALYQGPRNPIGCNILEFSNEGVNIKPLRYVDDPSPSWVSDSAQFAPEDITSKTISWPRPSSTPAAALSNQQSAAAIPGLANIPVVDTSRLFRKPDGKYIFCAPRIMTHPFVDTIDSDEGCVQIDLTVYLIERDRVQIEFQSEFGGTVAASHVGKILSDAGYVVHLTTASDLPNHQPKFDDALSQLGVASPQACLIVDDVDVQKDRRLTDLLKLANNVGKIVCLSRVNNVIGLANPVETRRIFSEEALYLWPLARTSIRNLAAQVFDPVRVENVEEAVNKTYVDLLALAIPLTPSNVIMYLSILHSEKDFTPVDRVALISRYMLDSLARPSDQLSSTFGARDKLNLLSSFMYSLFDNKAVSFDQREWRNFCRTFRDETLDEFSADDILRELEGSRILERAGQKIYVRYAFIYDFLIGFHVSGRPDRLKAFVDGGYHRRLTRVVEVVAAMANDPTGLIDAIQDELVGHLTTFSEKYVTAGYDPVELIEWKHSESDDQYWKEIAHQVSEGPSTSDAIDKVKTSIYSETRSARQEVIIRDFEKMEVDLFAAAIALASALRTASGLDAHRRLSALRAILAVDLIVLQIATAFSKNLASNRYFGWGGILFVNEGRLLADDADPDVVTAGVMTAVDYCGCHSLVQRVGTRRLAGLFKSYRSRTTDISEFELLRLFYLVLRTKPEGWPNELKAIIDSIHYTKWRVKVFVRLLMGEFKIEINRDGDLESIKQLVAYVQAKRFRGVSQPGSKLVKDIRQKLEEAGQFDREREGESEPGSR